MNHAIFALPAGANSNETGQDKAESAYHHYYQNGEKISPLDLHIYGYRLTARFVVINDQYRIFELLPTDSSHPARKSFLSYDIKSHGVVVNGAFHEHKNALNSSSPHARSVIMRKTQPVKKTPGMVLAISGPKEKEAPIPVSTVPGRDPRYYVVEV